MTTQSSQDFFGTTTEPNASAQQNNGTSVAPSDFFGGNTGAVAKKPEKESSGMTVSPFFPSAKTDTPVVSGLKTLGNVVPSAANLVVGLGKGVVQGYKNISKIPGEVKGLVKESGGVIPATNNFLEGLYHSLVPEGTQGVLKSIAGSLHGDKTAVDEGLQTAQSSVTNDPVGNILPYLTMGREVAYKVSPEAGTAFDNAIHTVGGPGAKVVSKVASIPGKVIGGVGNLGKFGVSQATGLDPSTINQGIEVPSSISKKAQMTVDRPSVASGIKVALDAREEALSETGHGYNVIRQANGDVPAMINVEPNFLGKQIQQHAGMTVGEDGRLQSSGSSSIRDTKDINGLQHFYDRWQPYFEQGQMTPHEFLNMRTDLSKLSKFDREISKSGDLEATSKGIRANLNNEYRSQIPGLDEIDANYSSQISELQDLRKGILGKDGELTDAGINKIANATNKGRTTFLSQLEEIKPGITQQVKALKAIEDIQNVHGHKVATYSRSILGGGGALAAIGAGNVPALIGVVAAAILSSPDVAIPLIRTYGHIKGFTSGVVDVLKKGGSTVNNLPQGAPSMLSKFTPVSRGAR